MSRSIGAVNYARGIDQDVVFIILLVDYVWCARAGSVTTYRRLPSVSYLLGQFEQCDLFHIVYLKIKQN